MEETSRLASSAKSIYQGKAGLECYCLPKTLTRSCHLHASCETTLLAFFELPVLGGLGILGHCLCFGLCLSLRLFSLLDFLGSRLLTLIIPRLLIPRLLIPGFSSSPFSSPGFSSPGLSSTGPTPAASSGFASGSAGSSGHTGHHTPRLCHASGRKLPILWLGGTCNHQFDSHEPN